MWGVSMAGPEGIYNWHRLNGRITTSGQPTEAQLAEIRDLGVRHIINLGQFPRPVMRGPAGLHADQAGRQGAEERHYLRAPQSFARDDPADGVNAVHLKDVLRDIKADRGRLHGGRLPSLWRSRRPLWHIAMPGAGAVHIIMLACSPRARVR